MLNNLYKKYKEIINYLIFGGLTTVVSIVTYALFAKVFNIDYLISNVLSWVLAVLFAYITNKIFVFESETKSKRQLLKECVSFFLARIISGILCDVGTFALMVRVFNINDIFSKIVTQAMVVIVNYIFSKFIVFRKK